MSSPIEDGVLHDAEKMYLDAYEENMPRIFRHIVSRVGDRKTAEDLTSETFFRTWDYLRKQHTIENIKAFCFKVANNLIADHYHARAKRPSVSLEGMDEFITSSRPVDDPLLQTEVSLLRELLNDLPSDYGAILAYRYIDDFDISEIATITGKSHSHVYVLIHRAKNALKEKIKKIS
jgi:RNA polymerase sigma-70 factor (ECF subfamily)